MLSIENDYLRVEFKALGAEMTRLYDKVALEERLWSGDAKYWGKQAPVLFPFVGSSKNGQYSYGGKSYPMGRHGFAREMVFEVVEHSKDSIVFGLKANEMTQSIYPFAFDFQITYAIMDNQLKTTYRVFNSGESVMIFSVGSHPAFHADYRNRRVYLEFEKEERLETIKIDLETGLLKGLKEPIALTDRRLLLTEAVFRDDALVFEHLESSWVKLVDEAYEKSVQVTIDAFPSLGIWSPFAPFVCIEPWQGTADYDSTTGCLEDKEGVVTLNPREHYAASFLVSLES